MEMLEYWANRWQNQQTGFHEGKPNELLVAHLAAIEAVAGPELRILVPLAGKTEDLGWLSDRGHTVVGVEFVRQAIDELFAGAKAVPHKLGELDARTVGKLTMVHADIFAVTAAALGTFDLVYDRGALIALDPQQRAPYVALCRSLLNPRGQTLLIAIAYDQSRSSGPPWSADSSIVHELFAGRSVDSLEKRSITPPKGLAAAGITDVVETLYVIGT